MDTLPTRIACVVSLCLAFGVLFGLPLHAMSKAAPVSVHVAKSSPGKARTVYYVQR